MAAQDSLVIYDEILSGTSGNLHIIVEIPKVESRTRLYLQALKSARSIPFDLDAINPLDKMYQYVLEKFPNYAGKPELSRGKVREFYEQQQGNAYRDAVMLAVTSSKDNVFDFEPIPYEEDDSFLEEDDLPGLVSAPRITPNLDDPTERRVKQLYDWLKANPTHLIQLQGAFELAVIKVNEMAVKPKLDADGFQPRPIASNANKELVGPHLLPKA